MLGSSRVATEAILHRVCSVSGLLARYGLVCCLDCLSCLLSWASWLVSLSSSVLAMRGDTFLLGAWFSLFARLVLLELRYTGFGVGWGRGDVVMWEKSPF